MHHKFNQLHGIDLACVRGEETIFSELEVHAKSAEVVQLQGANGSGKTSLLRILCGISQPAEGSVRWNDIEIATEAEGFRREIGYVGHRRGVCEDLTPLENVLFANALGTPRPEAECLQALTRLGLAHVAGIPTRLLSAGQNQRTALARLLVSDAACWFLDEPFTALDRGGREVIEAVIAEHAAAGGISIVATHQPMTLTDTNVRTLQLDRT
ncbi:MAG TPA: cytochrome c biogenesis heme-transporting ATPase CcmA [Gammaproteobacteria bacterium]|nr:cytochrome c biogenesis heme-transporting ATPase CcmA [Gammaproteobacteria bacterium]